MEKREPSLKNGQYFTISEAVEAETTIQRSRFIATLRRVENRQNVDKHLKEIATLYPRATHYCWAYRFTGTPVQEHSSDAGEPTGSAGRPILGALKKYSLENILGVVIRYYGGIKLGIKGLISAYGETTLLAVKKSTRIVFEPSSTIAFTSSYDLYNIFLSRAERYSIPTTSIKVFFEEKVSGEITVPYSLLEQFEKELREISPASSSFRYEIKEEKRNS